MFIQVYSTDNKDYIFKYKDINPNDYNQMYAWIAEQLNNAKVNKIVIKKYPGNKSKDS